MVVDEPCKKATYKTVSLHDFIYENRCFPKGWEEFLDKKEVLEEIRSMSPALAKDAEKYQIEPPMHSVFKAFEVRRDDVKVIILGQDPTPQANQATGMAFSLNPGVDPRNVPSVFNMLVELKWEGMNVGLSNGDLTPWLEEGVLLLNAVLTVRQGSGKIHRRLSHQPLWKKFTALLLQHINKTCKRSAWILWGNEAIKVAVPHIDRRKHYIKAGEHPSPQGAKGRGFFGRNYFHCANKFLVRNAKRGGVRWRLLPHPGPVTDMERCDADGL